MARRGIALLTRDYESPMVSRSGNKRWVLYERYGLPCVIDTRTMTEELLGEVGAGPKLFCSYQNEELAPTVLWHPGGDMVAMSVIEHRHFRNVWIWTHGRGLRQLGFLEGLPEPDADRVGHLTADATRWVKNQLEIQVVYSFHKGDRFATHEAVLRWDPATDQLTLLSDKVIDEGP